MVSIRNSLSELERSYQLRAAALDCYKSALKNLAHYVVEVDDSLTEPHRKHLAALFEDVARDTPEALEESRATLRGLLRDYRDKASQFLSSLREDLASTARSLEELLDSLAQADGDQETQLRTTLAQLRTLADSALAGPTRGALRSVADSIESSLEQIRKQHHLTVSQFQAEIRMLHKRIDVLETAVAVDNLTKLFSRSEMEDRVRTTPGAFCLLLARVTGFRLAESRFQKETAEELAAAFAKRLRNGLPPSALVGRWSHEEFMALLDAPKADVMALARWVSEHLSGSYACLQSGKTVRPVLQISVAVLESGGDTRERVLARVGEFLVG